MKKFPSDYLRYTFADKDLTDTATVDYFTAKGFTKVSVRIDATAGNWAAAANVKLQESIDGTNWTDISSFTADGETVSVTVNFDRLRLVVVTAGTTTDSKYGATVLLK